jgi:hypothetical protein
MIYIFQILRALGRYYFLYVEFSHFYVNQSLAGQTIVIYFLVGILRSASIQEILCII